MKQDYEETTTIDSVEELNKSIRKAISLASENITLGELFGILEVIRFDIFNLTTKE